MTVDLPNTLVLTEEQNQRLRDLLTALINQEQAQVIVPAQDASTGYWFGGGNLIEMPDGNIWLTGRYRNYGDSRTGLGTGQRGLECAIFKSTDRGKTFERALSFSKADLSTSGREVISIEGTALHIMQDGRIELFISSEKGRPYPAGVGIIPEAGNRCLVD